MKTLGWCVVATLLLLLLLLAFGCSTSPMGVRPFPLPLTEEIGQYIVQQGRIECDTQALLVTFLEKDEMRFILFSSEADPATGLANWALIYLHTDASQNYMWVGTATEVQASVTGGGAVPDNPDWCQRLAWAPVTL